MQISYILTTITLISILALGGVVYFKDPKNKTNRSFMIMVLWLAIWMSSNFLENEFRNIEIATLMLKIDFASASFLVYYWWKFSFNFPNISNISGKKKLLIFIPATIFAFLSFTNLIICNIIFANNAIQFQPGKLFSLYAIYIFAYMIIGSCGSLILKYRKAKGLEKIQILYVLLGLSISASIAVIVNIFLQNILPVEFFRIGIYGFIFLIGFTAYAILKHHLMNIKVIATEVFASFILITLLVDALLAKTISEFILKLGIFIISAFFGILLIKSTLKEIKSAEKIKELADDLAHANKKLESANKELRRLDEAKSEFLSIASHQLRTPLTAMKGLSSMLLEGDYGDISEKPKKAVSQIFESSERMNKLVNNLLNISRIESGRLKFNFEKVNFQELVKGVVEELKIVAEEKGLSIDLKLPKNEIILKIDKQIIRQVILNFLDNSIKYTGGYANERRSPSLIDCGRTGKYGAVNMTFTSADRDDRNISHGEIPPNPPLQKGGASIPYTSCPTLKKRGTDITVKTEILTGSGLKEILKKTLRYGNAKIKIKAGDKFVVLSVKDRGRGVSTDEQSRLFEKFTRGNGVSTVYTEGTGLGLYVCRKMVEAHRGYIWAESAGKGSGSRFAFAVGAG